jgi:hypothetical protein
VASSSGRRRESSRRWRGRRSEREERELVGRERGFDRRLVRVVFAKEHV